MGRRPVKLSDQLRRAIRDCGQTRYKIAKSTGVSQSALSLFCSGKRGLSMEAIDSLILFFEWKLVEQPSDRKDS
jgi:predicted transcriptional regulator